MSELSCSLNNLLTMSEGILPKENSSVTIETLDYKVNFEIKLAIMLESLWWFQTRFQLGEENLWPVFLYSTGRIQLLCITDADMVKEVGLCSSLSLGKPSYLSKDRGPLLGLGIVSTSGPIWAHQRKIIAPEFYPDKVKRMMSLMVDSTTSILRCWEDKIIKSEEKGIADIKIDEDLRSLSADIISRACFGSNYSQGKHIFSKLRALQQLMSSQTIGVPASRFMPTKSNRGIWRLEKEIQSMILQVVNRRMDDACNEKDLLQMILEGAKNYGDDIDHLGMNRDKFIVDNCKTIYFAGHETTAITASWCLMLLAANPEWQTRARVEVLEICRDGSVPNAAMLQKMKTLTMVIQETLRLYSPAMFIVREALKDIKLKDIVIPKGVNIQIPIKMLHEMPSLWGSDAHKFNPERFKNGIVGASKIPHAYIPFGVGNRICAGQHLAMVELKVILSLMLSKFYFSLSPDYRHCPASSLVVEPKHGVRLHVKRV
ncbi:hypothetical protein FNV43_RR10792 [Rhamnella rubrinervis]|uniref:Cytochrome P450 n=1 Tax=Rhamnella rubrinervis TaxID=2594499 RepID=A0A8K0H4K9_9ROSA|nr:hypothetical protein FNV43_RR10792 [Rhamnella rubrinervis]